MADAESTNDTETIQLTPTNGNSTTWRILDRYAGTCSATYRARREDGLGQTNRLTLSSSDECSGTNAFSATAVVLAEGSTELDVRLSIGGQQAVSIGYMLGADYGDAPASYGASAAPVQPTWTGGTLAAKYTTYNIIGTNRVSLATIGPPTRRLGAQAFPNAVPPYSAQADGDVGLAGTVDEDAFTAAPGVVTVAAGMTTYTLPGVLCSPSSGATVRGWIDWNRNGVFDTNEGSTPASGVACPSGGAVTLNFAVPTALPTPVAPAGDLTFLRLRVSSTASQLASPTATLVEGEVEDWPLRMRVPRLTVTKVANRTEVPGAGQVVTYTVTLSNVGNGDYTAANPAYLYDSYGSVVDDATVPVPSGMANNTSTRVLQWSGALAAGAQTSFAIPVTMRAGDPGDLVLTNTVRASSVELTSTARATPGSPRLSPTGAPSCRAPESCGGTRCATRGRSP